MKNDLKVKEFAESTISGLISIELSSEYRFKGITGKDLIWNIINTCEKVIDCVN